MKHILLVLVLFISITPAVTGQKKPVVKKKQPITKPPSVPTEGDLRKAYRAEDYAKVITLAERRLATLPGDKTSMVVKALSYAMSGNKEMVLKTALALYPVTKDTAAIFLATLPASLSREKRKSDAAWYIQEAHKLHNSPIIYLMEASYLLDDSMFDKARSAAIAGAALLSDKDDLAIKSQFASLLQASGEKDQGFELINSLVKKNPEDTIVVAQHYAMLLADKKYPESLTEMNHLMRLKGETRKLRKERTFLYQEMGRHEDACVEAAKLASEDDVFISLQRKLGCAEVLADITPGHVKSYTYNVDYYGMKYEFIVWPKSVKMNAGVDFDWAMTINADKKGTVTIDKYAIDTAHSQMNKFSSGPLSLNAATTVWVSNDVFKEIKNNGMSVISASDEGPKVFRIVKDDYDNEPLVTMADDKQKALKTLHVRSDDGAEELWINDDPANPLITRMNIGWSIELTSIE